MLKLAKLTPDDHAVIGPAAGVGCFPRTGRTFGHCRKSAISFRPSSYRPWCRTAVLLMRHRLVGKARATEMKCCSEKKLTGKSADWGLILKCVEELPLMDEAAMLAKRLANAPTVALGVMRQNWQQRRKRYASALVREPKGQRSRWSTAKDAREGPRCRSCKKRQSESKVNEDR